ncbi:guanine nucleotide exchange factor [Anaeramoeba ignava]|uniref:Guanine nucleotide exchange factor n=1 Tax=Anaeramoeba ignava TaxID=1746090 RepID=A0A9Q0LYM6_ANAIG|nr:guanine nucleotide exchange factor [Anaeramoeba ignava]|eukprot:Anaeramoba_ignava/a349478_33.p1 GENE.a349478_33~~a349478_33.p1  ORF type:complete len:900 (+),score=197.81 a349478_33:33-2732(+)
MSAHKQQKKNLHHQKRTITVKLLDGSESMPVIEDTTTVSDLLSMSLVSKRNNKVEGYQIFGYEPNKTGIDNENTLNLHDKLFPIGDFLDSSSLVSNFAHLQLEVRHTPQEKVLVILPPDPKDLTPRHEKVSIDKTIPMILYELCSQFHLPESEFALFLKLPYNASHSFFKPTSSFLLNPKVNQKQFPTSQQGFWLELNQHRKLLTYTSVFDSNEMLFLQLQRKPGKVSVEYDEFDEKTDEKIGHKVEEILLDFTAPVKTFIQQFTETHYVPTKYIMSLFHAITDKKKKESDQKESFVANAQSENDTFVDSDFEIVPTNHKDLSSDTEIYAKEDLVILELNNLTEDFSFAQQAVPEESLLKFVPTIPKFVVRREMGAKSTKNNFDQFLDQNFDSNLDHNFFSDVSDQTFFWDEIKSQIPNILWEEGGQMDEFRTPIFERIRGASLNKSIEILTSIEGFEPEFVDLFFEMMPTITDEMTFLSRLFERFKVPIGFYTSDQKTAIQSAVIGVTEKMIEFRPYKLPQEIKTMIRSFVKTELKNHYNKDFRERGKNVLGYLSNKKKIRRRTAWATFTSSKNLANSSFFELAKVGKTRSVLKLNRTELMHLNNDSSELHNIPIEPRFRPKKTRSTSKKKSQKYRDMDPSIPQPIIPKEKDIRMLTLFKIDSYEIAKQITLETHKLFSKIKTQEFLNNSWTKPNKKTLSPDILKMINWFNHLADWTATQILMYRNLKERVKVFEKMITIAVELYIQNNLNDTMAIASGMQMMPIERLTKTRALCSQKLLDWLAYIEKLTDAVGSYRAMRTHIRTKQPPLIPYLGMYLATLTTLEELPSRIENNLINWAKRRRIFRAISEIKTFQSVDFKFYFVPQIKQFLYQDKCLDENQLWDISCEFEPDDQEDQF